MILSELRSVGARSYDVMRPRKKRLKISSAAVTSWGLFLEGNTRVVHLITNVYKIQ
jgi:hypothetical protein